MDNIENKWEFDAFISYRHLDETEAEQLGNFLYDFRLTDELREKCKRNCNDVKFFRDIERIRPGYGLSDEIRKALDKSRNLIVLCSEHTNESNEAGLLWVNEEVKYFIKEKGEDIRNGKSKIIPLILPLSEEIKKLDLDKKRERIYPVAIKEYEEIKGEEIYYLEMDNVARSINSQIIFKGKPVSLVFQNHPKDIRTRKVCYYLIIASILGMEMEDLYGYMPKVLYYEDYVERYNLPVGIEPLSEEEVKKRDFVYKFREEENKLREVECCDSQGNLIERNTFDGVDKSVKMKFTYREGRSIEEGGLEKTEHFNKMGGLIKVVNYEDLDTINYSVIKEHKIGAIGKVKNISIKSNESTIQKDNPYSIEKEVPRYVVDRENGFITKQAYVNSENKSISVEGVYAISFTRDKLGRVVEKRYLDEVGNVANNRFGVAGINIKSIKSGNITEKITEFVKVNNKLTFHSKYQMAYVKDTMVNGVLESREFFDEKGNPCFSFLGYHKAKYCYDEINGQLYEELYYGADNQLCYDYEGKAGVLYKVDDVTKEFCAIYLGTNEMPVLNNAGIGVVRTYKERREEEELIVQSFHRNEGGNSYVNNSLGVAIIEKYYDSNGMLVKFVCKNDRKERCLNTNNIAEIRFEYDDKYRRLKKESYYDKDAQKCLCKGNYAEVKMEYDARGYKVGEMCLGVDGRPCLNRDCYANIEWDYDESGNMIREVYRGLDGSLCLHKDGYAGLEFEYDESGNMIRKMYLGLDGKLCLHKDGFAAIEQKYDKKGGIVKKMYLGLDEKPCLYKYGFAEVIWSSKKKLNLLEELCIEIDSSLNNNYCAGWLCEYDERGNVIKKIGLGVDGNPCLYKNSYAGWERMYDERRLLIREIYLGLDGKPCLIGNRCAGWICEYDERGNEIAKMYLGVDGKPCLYKGNYAGWVLNYDERGNQISRVYLGVDSKPCIYEDKYAGWLCEYDERGNVIMQVYFDVDYKLCLCKDEYAGWKRQYDERGNVIMQVYFDVDYKLCLCKDENVGWERQYDERGNVIKELHLGLDGKPCVYKDVYAGWERLYDERKNVIKEVYLGVDGNPIACKDGYAGWERIYDERGWLIRKMYLGVDDKPCVYKDNIAGFISDYDEKRRITRETYLGVDGKPIVCKDGYAGWEHLYNDKMFIIRIIYLGIDGKPIVCKDGCAGWSADYDEDGRMIEEISLGVDYKPCLCMDGYAGWERLYDERGNVVKQKFFGVNRKPMVHQEFGCAEVVMEYDARGNKVKEMSLGLDGKPCLCKYGYAEIRYEYNTQGQKTKERYYDEKGNYIKTIDYTK